MKPLTFFRSEAREGLHAPRLLLAHGAGAPADSDFMEEMAVALSVEGVSVVRFEFPYMEQRRRDGRKRPPDRQPVLLEHFRQAVATIAAETTGGGPIFVGGKSMGGRMASHMITQTGVQPEICGAVCFGYPFHPPGKRDQWRTSHFQDLRRPLLIIQGTRDPFGKMQEVESHGAATLEKNVHLSWLEGGDHDLRPLARQAENHNDMIRQAASAAAAFMQCWK